MSADSYRSWEETVTTIVICTLCGWRSEPIHGAHDDGPAISAFYAHFHASCLAQAAAGVYDDEGPRYRAAHHVLKGLSERCGSCEVRNAWCDHRQPPKPDPVALYSWAINVPEWVR